MSLQDLWPHESDLSDCPISKDGLELIADDIGLDPAARETLAYRAVHDRVEKLSAKDANRTQYGLASGSFAGTISATY